MGSAKIVVPSSSANCGPGYDIWCVGTEKPYLSVACERTTGGIEIDCKSPYQPPQGRQLGYAGRKAAEQFLRDFGIKEGVRIRYEDSEDGYPTGGLGRSGAEIVGALLAAALAYDKKLSREDLIGLSHEIEGHPDNVAASINGRFNVIAQSPYTSRLLVDRYDVPENLGLAIGFSSHKKTGGTEAGREVLREPVPATDFVAQTGIVSMLTAALVSGNTDRALEVIWGDRFHEPRRADVEFYGKFGFQWLAELKRQLFADFHVGWCVSGAGPNMQAWYKKDEYSAGIVPVIERVIVPRFRERGIEMNLKEMQIAREGAYDYAQREYGFGK